MKQTLAGLVAGLVFGGGLALAGMTDPAVVLGFLDIAGAWNPALLAVMAVAVPVTFVGYRLVGKLSAPLLAPDFGAAARREIDGRLLAGAGLFGIGWGLSGYCPGPAIASLPQGASGLIAFLVAVLAGSLAVQRLLPGNATLGGPRTAGA